MKMLSNGRWTFPVLLFFGALLIRVLAVMALRHPTLAPTAAQMGDDAVNYNTFASQLALGHGYSWQNGSLTSFCAPGLSFMLALIYWVVGFKYVVVYAAFCFMGAASCVLAYAIAAEVLALRTAKMAGVLASVYLPHIYFATLFATENVFIFCLALGVWLLLKYFKGGSLWIVAAAGIVLGYGALTRPFALLLLALCALVLAYPGRRRISGLVAAAVFTVTASAVIIPWTVRNYELHHKLVLVATNGGGTFYGGNNQRVYDERVHWGGWVPSIDLPQRELIDAASNEVERDAVQWRLGVQWLREHPVAIPIIAFFKFIRMWLPDIDSSNRTYALSQWVAYSPFLVLFLAAAVRGVRWRHLNRPWALLHAVILATVLTSMIFWGSPRFRDANAPILMIYAAVGLEVLVGRFWKGASSGVPEKAVADRVNAGPILEKNSL